MKIQNREKRDNHKTETKKTLECLKCGEYVGTQQIYCTKCNKDFVMREYYPYNL